MKSNKLIIQEAELQEYKIDISRISAELTKKQRKKITLSLKDQLIQTIEDFFQDKIVYQTPGEVHVIQKSDAS